ncbi:MAG: hypothetical protein GY952_02165 [Rhodobacteraceae bacterium]|nr:hypothetical protein [Paracoccaceae bacterium]
MSGGLLAAINLSRNPPEFPLNLLLNRSFPVPGVDGLTLRLEHRGGQIAWSDIGGSGVSAQAGGRSTGERFQGEVSITLDLTRWFPALQ